MSVVLVTGGSGRIGSHIVRGLVESGNCVRIADVRPPGSAPPGTEFLVCDLTQDDAVAEAVRGVDAVVHLAGHPSAPDWQSAGAINLASAWSVFDRAVRAGARQIVFASSIHVVGSYPAGTWLDDGLLAAPDGPYGMSKHLSELMLADICDRCGVAGWALRIGAFRDEPTNARELAFWLSPGDAARLVGACLSSEEAGFHMLWGFSDNRRAPVSKSGWIEAGYIPRDDAERFASRLRETGVDISIVSEWPLIGGRFAEGIQAATPKTKRRAE